ncbi:MAG: cell division protein SepF [Bacillota bacterium]
MSVLVESLSDLLTDLKRIFGFARENNTFSGEEKADYLPEEKVIILKPKSFSEAKKVIDMLKAKQTVILNLNLVERKVATKILDFISGAVYSLDNNLEKIDSNIFLFTPRNIELDESITNDEVTSSD